MSDPIVTWTRPKLKLFVKAYSEAVIAGKKEFTFDGHHYVVGYAEYLIQYLDSKLEK